MFLKLVRSNRCTSAGSLPKATWAVVASAPRVITSGPLVPVTMRVLLATNAEPASVDAAAGDAEAARVGPVDTKPTARAPTTARPSGRAPMLLYFGMEISFRVIEPTLLSTRSENHYANRR